MEVRTYRAKEMKDALEQIKRDLGSDALIISSRTISDGFWNKKMVEVRAAKYEESQPETKKTSAGKSVYGPIPGVLPIYYAEKEDAVVNEVKGYGQQKYGLGQPAKNTVKNSYFPRVPAPRPPQKRLALNETEQNVAEQVEELLKDKGIDNETASFLSEMWSVEMPPNILGNRRAFHQYIVKLLAKHLICEPYEVKRRGVKILAMVGPTGSGKTTTAAKVAAREALINGERVGLISADGYRIAASEQLKQYAELIDIPLEIVQSRKEMSIAVRRLTNKGINLIIIDTAGRNYKDSGAINRLKYLLSAAGNVDVHLVLSAVTRDRELEAVIDSHQVLHPSKLVVTKTDEALTNGVILNVQNYSQLPISILGTGQKVPEDMELAQAEKLAELILR